jgi:hypothetical protein
MDSWTDFAKHNSQSYGTGSNAAITTSITPR